MENGPREKEEEQKTRRRLEEIRTFAKGLRYSPISERRLKNGGETEDYPDATVPASGVSRGTFGPGYASSIPDQGTWDGRGEAGQKTPRCRVRESDDTSLRSLGLARREL